MNEKTKLILVDVISALFMMLFIYAALTKIEDFQRFNVELGKSPVLNRYGSFIAIGIPVFEIVICALLFTKRFQYYGLHLSFGIMAVFSFYIIGILKFSPYIPCSCGGILQNMNWTQHLIFNTGFILLGAIAILIYPNRK